MKQTFFGRHALLVLVVVFFLVPFAMRSARLTVQGMRNDVKDWLPSNFDETKEMDWFWHHFLGERFVIASWEGCQEGDESYHLLLKKMQVELPPSYCLKQLEQEEGSPAANTPTTGSPQDSDVPALAEKALHSRNVERPFDFVGDRLGLFSMPNEFHNWGGLDEKWLAGFKGQWYYITPNGYLYRWNGGDAPLASQAGKIYRDLFGGQISGTHIATFGEDDGLWYYENPRRLNAQLFKTITTGPDVLAGMTAEGGVLHDNPKEAEARLKGSLFGKDGKQTAMILTLTDAGRKDFHRVIGRGALGKPRGRLYDLAAECGISMQDLHIGGPPVDNVAIDEEGSITLVRLVSLCMVLGTVLAYACFRSVSATVMVFFVGGISAILSLALVGWFGSTMDAILMSMPALVYTLGISGAVHIINYYREAVEEHGIEGAPERAIVHSWKPAFLCSLTTALGLFSLVTSEIVPIRKFGIFSGIAVLATLVIMFTYLPAGLQLWPQRPRTADQKRRDENPWYEKYLSKFWDRFGGGIIRHHYAVASICMLVVVTVGWGVMNINTTVNMLKMFDSKSKILNDYSWLENNVGKLVPMEVVVKVRPRMLKPLAEDLAARRKAAPQNSSDADGKAAVDETLLQLSFLERMEIVDRIQKVVEQEFGEPGQGIAGRSMSAATFAPILPPPKGDTSSYMRRTGTNSRLEAHRNQFLKSEYLRMDREDQSELWRISLRIGALQDVDYGEFVRELKCAVEPVMAAYQQREEILRQLIVARDGKIYANARVLILGAPITAAVQAKPNPDATAKQDEKPKAGAIEINQTKIFVETLRDLLSAARVRVDFHNPAASPLPENWESRLAAYDCVIVASNHNAYDAQVLKDRSKLLLDASHHVFNPELAASSKVAKAEEPNIRAVYTGVVPIVYKAQRTLLNSLIESTAWSFLTITPLMMFLSRSFWAGIVAMLPNVLPVFVIFGAMGWMRVQVDIGSMMTASIALGVAVDDTIHYLTWFREELDQGKSRHEAILIAYKKCATPTFQAAVISGLGLSIFAFSTFTPTQRFGYLMLSILFMGVVAELIFFPALLAGPLGKAFKPRLKPAPDSPHAKHHHTGHGDHSASERIDDAHPLSVTNHAPTRDSAAIH